MSTAPRLSDLSPDDPTEQQRAQWRKWASTRRQREGAGERVFGLPLPEWLIVGALMATNPGRTDFTDHEECEALLAVLVYKHLEWLMHDLPDEELKLMKLNFPLLRLDFAK